MRAWVESTADRAMFGYAVFEIMQNGEVVNLGPVSLGQVGDTIVVRRL